MDSFAVIKGIIQGFFLQKMAKEKQKPQNFAVSVFFYLIFSCF